MQPSGKPSSTSWRLAILSMAGLVVAIAAADLLGLGVMDRVRRITEQTVTVDIALEDRSDDFRVAVLDMRHYHRNITFAGPSRRGLADFDTAHALLLVQIDRLEELAIDDLSLPSPQLLREQAQLYYDEFRPAIDLYDTDRQAFTQASDTGLIRLAELSDAARQFDHVGEQRASAALRSVEVETDRAEWALLAMLGGLTLIGGGLIYLALRTVREQQQAAQVMEHTLKLKNDFIADASHELRTPLTVLRANAELALQLDDGCAHRELLDEILQESDRMTNLVADLLFLASSDTGSLPLQLDLVEVAPFLAELADRAAVLAGENGATFRTELRVGGLVEIDGARIEQVMLILVDNASKYSPPGTLVTLRSAVRGDDLIIEVADEGPGIPPAELPLVFERFYRVDKARSRRQGGTGLGLPIARSILDAHGGRIEAESVVGHGTTMRIRLKLLRISGESRG
jgi:signal transduction histidine kinase